MNTSHWITKAMATPSANTGKPPILDPPWLPARAISTATTTAMTVLMSALRLFWFTDSFLSPGPPHAAARPVPSAPRRARFHPTTTQPWWPCPLGVRSVSGIVWVEVYSFRVQAVHPRPWLRTTPDPHPTQGVLHEPPHQELAGRLRCQRPHFRRAGRGVDPAGGQPALPGPDRPPAGTQGQPARRGAVLCRLRGGNGALRRAAQQPWGHGAAAGNGRCAVWLLHLLHLGADRVGRAEGFHRPRGPDGHPLGSRGVQPRHLGPG